MVWPGSRVMPPKFCSPAARCSRMNHGNLWAGNPSVLTSHEAFHTRGRRVVSDHGRSPAREGCPDVWHTQIRAEVIDSTGHSLGAGDSLDALRSPKALIRRVTPADETRWRRAVAGATTVLPYRDYVQPAVNRERIGTSALISE